MIEQTILSQEYPTSGTLSFSGSVGKDRKKGSESIGHLMFVWSPLTNPETTSCSYDKFVSGTASVFDLDGSRLRIRDAQRQAEFIVSRQPHNSTCEFPEPVYDILSGFQDVLVAYNATSERQEPDASLQDLYQRYRRQIPENNLQKIRTFNDFIQSPLADP